MKFHSASALVLAALVSAGCLGLGADDGATSDPAVVPPVAFTMDGVNCRELLIQASVPVSVAREFVPANYSLLGEETGRAVAFGALKACDDLVLDGASAGAASTSDVGVFIEAPDGTDGFHYYQTWWHTDHAALRARLHAQGWLGELVNGTVVDDARAGGVAGTVSFEVPAADGAYAGEASVAGAPAPATNVATGWFDGPRGTLKVVKELPATEFGGGQGTLTAAEGSPMAKLLGAASASGPAIWNVYDMTGRVEPVATE